MSDQRSQTWRYNLVFGLLMLAVPALCVHVGFVMRHHGAMANRLAAIQQQTTLPLPGRMGSIYARARNGYVPLAVSRQVLSCFFDPQRMDDSQLLPTADRVSEVLQLNRPGLRETFLSRREGRFVWLEHDIADAEVRGIKALRLPAVGIRPEWRREYPNASLGATVVGFRLLDGGPGGGLELTLSRVLAAEDGEQVALADAARRSLLPIPERSKPPRDGCHVMLCLDAVIQGFLQEAVSESVEKYEAHWGAGIVMDPHTGQVLAMFSAPTYDPNKFNRATPNELTNPAIVSPFEPGSAFKPIIAAAAVQSGVVSWQTTIHCEGGSYNAPKGGHISDHGKHYGVLSLAEIVAVSSNIGMAKVGEMLGNRAMWEIVQRFGFGHQTGIELPGETPGILRPVRDWDGYSLRRVPFGQEISVNALQLATAFCVFANGGKLMKPSLVERITDPAGRTLWQAQPQVVREALSPQVAAQALEVMTGVVADGGTGTAARMALWSSAGKTGTAQVPIPNGGGYNDRDFAGTFVGIAPASQPRLVCLITIFRPNRSKGYYGGTVAAPYVKQVMEKSLAYLDVPPDQTAEEQGHGKKVLAAASPKDATARKPKD